MIVNEVRNTGRRQVWNKKEEVNSVPEMLAPICKLRFEV